MTIVPSLGRFLQIDPVQGGTPSAYVYVLDPINYADYGGQWGIPKWVKTVAIVAVAAIVVVGVVAACIVACVAIGAAISAAALSVTAYAAQAAATAAVLAIAASRAAPSVARAISAVVKGGKAANNVGKSASVAQQIAKSNAPARITNPPVTSAFEKYTEGMVRSNTIQNTTRVDSVLRPGRYRVPDSLNARELIETKNVVYQPLSSQLRDYAAISQRDTLSFILKINSDARLSGPLINAEKDGLLTIIKY